MAEIRAAGAIVFCGRSDPRYLLLRSSKHGEWGPPKGHADADETEFETAVREIVEETGLKRLRFLDGFRSRLSYRIERKGKARQKEVILFLAEMEDGEAVQLSSEHKEWKLAPLSEVERLVKHADILALFRRAEKFIRTQAGKIEGALS